MSAPPTVPQPGQVIDSLKPTLRWPSIDYSYGFAGIGGQYARITPQTGNSYTSRDYLSPYVPHYFRLNYFAYSTADLPGTITSVSGPDLNLLPMSFQYQFESTTEFSVAPEPNALCLLLAAAPLALRRKRHAAF